MAWCDNCGNGFAGDGGTCPTCGNKIPYGSPTALPAAEVAPMPLTVAQPAGSGFTFSKFLMIGGFTASWVYGYLLHDGATASLLFFFALFNTVLVLCGK